MKSPVIIVFSLFLFIVPICLEAQITSPGFHVESGGIMQVGTRKSFWMISNQDARFHPDNPSIFGGVYIGSEVKRQNDLFEEPEDTTTEFTFDYGLEAFNRYNGNYDIQLNQYYAEASWWRFNLQAGARAESFGNQYDPLSSGSLLYSRNGKPMPKVSVSSDYIPVPYSQGYIEFKGYLSHGWFEKDRYTESPYLHHKNVYVRVGGDFPLNAHYGFHHYAMWGGYSPEYGQVAEGWDAFKKVFMVARGDSIDKEAKNAYGNHLGSRNFGLDYNGKDFGLHLYWQTIFEDNSGKVWRNIEDGLWGIVYRNKQKKPLLKGALYEFLHTTDQSGRYHEKDGEIVGGNDNYFNNYLYRSGWTSNSYTIGTPLITSPIIDQAESGQILINNKVIAHHLGLSGWLMDNLQYRTLLTYSINYGTNSGPFDPLKRDFSFLTEFHYKIPENPTWMIKTKLAGDLGNMYGPNFGVMVSVVRRSIEF